MSMPPCNLQKYLNYENILSEKLIKQVLNLFDVNLNFFLLF